MGSDINLEKIRQVHREMLAREARFADAKANCDWARAPIPRKKTSFLDIFDDSLDQLRHRAKADKPIAKSVVVRATHTEVRRITCGGKSLTISEWAKITSIPRDTIYQRLTAGWSAEDAVSVAVRDRRHMRARKAKAETMRSHKSLRGLAADHNMSRDTLVDRLKRGIQLDDALTTPVAKSFSIKSLIAFEDQKMRLEEWGLVYGISPYTLRNRLRNGWDISVALRTPAKASMGKKGKGGGGWSNTSADGAQTGGVGSPDIAPKQDFFQ